MSTRESILAAVATALAGVASGRVYRSRKEQLPALPAVVILPAAEDANEEVMGREDASLTVDVEVYAKGDTPDNAADATLAAVWTALRAAPTLGLGTDVQLMSGRRTSWDFEDYDYVRVTLSVTYFYRTATGAM